MQKVAVIGGGTMGSGIAYVTARAGLDTVLYDVVSEQINAARKYHAKTLSREQEKGRLTQEQAAKVTQHLVYSGNLAEAVDETDMIIEAVPESIELKTSLFRDIEQHVRPDTILGSNTSSLPITEIAAAVGRPDRVVGIHFFNPAPVMQLIEIIQGLQTSNDTVEAVVHFAELVGKEPVVVKDFPGFVTTRVGLMLVSEAIFALQEGVAEREALDKAMRLGYNLPMGPLALADLIGLDIVLHVLDALYANYHDDRYRAPILLRKMVQAGHLGRKTTKGFYDYAS